MANINANKLLQQRFAIVEAEEAKPSSILGFYDWLATQPNMIEHAKEISQRLADIRAKVWHAKNPLAPKKVAEKKCPKWRPADASHAKAIATVDSVGGLKAYTFLRTLTAAYRDVAAIVAKMVAIHAEKAALPDNAWIEKAVKAAYKSKTGGAGAGDADGTARKASVYLTRARDALTKLAKHHPAIAGDYVAAMLKSVGTMDSLAAKSEAKAELTGAVAKADKAAADAEAKAAKAKAAAAKAKAKAAKAAK
jgi:histone H1/5